MKLVCLYALLRLKGVRMVRQKFTPHLILWNEPDVWASEIESFLDAKSFIFRHVGDVLPKKAKLWEIDKLARSIYYDVVFEVGGAELNEDMKHSIFVRRERLPESIEALTKAIATIVILISVILYLAYFS